MVHTRFQVQVTPLSLFVRDSGMESVFVVKPSESFDPKTVLFRALVVVDFQGYNVFFNNCEHCESEGPLFHWRGLHSILVGLNAGVSLGGMAAMLTALQH